ncbi:WD40/YVTN/BNR-like repeat-containing protein [Chthonomonas calidirosea]|nr:YCF48-related protein [Chthonomonas calidirosea]
MQANEEKPSSFLVIDTGGSGGPFGRGDPHYHLSDVDFVNLNEGWACGYGGVFMTKDGGLSWEREEPRGDWIRIRVVAPGEVYLLEGHHPGGRGKVFLWHTKDGGKSWERVEALEGKLSGYWDMFFRGKEGWIISGWNPSFHTSDGGKTWKEVNFDNLIGQAYKIAIPADVPSRNGYVLYVWGGAYKEGNWMARLLKSEDGGKTWKVLPLPEEMPAQAFAAMCFPTSRMGWIGLEGGKLLFTKDGGESWEWLKLPTERRVVALWIDQIGDGFASIDNSDVYHITDCLYETHDYGKTWQVVLSGYKQLNAIASIGPGYLWAVGYEPTLVPDDIVAILQRW